MPISIVIGKDFCQNSIIEGKEIKTMNTQEQQKRIEEIKQQIAVYERNITCLEACDWEKYESLCAELKKLEA